MRFILSHALLALAVLLMFPLALSAQDQDTGPTSSIYCPRLTVTLQFGSRDSTTGGQVTELQRFLSDYYDLNPDDYVTGFFGRLTRDNVRRFQCEKMQICSGTENSTGWGVVGPLTRAAIRNACGAQTTTTTTPPPPTKALLRFMLRLLADIRRQGAPRASLPLKDREIGQ